MRRTLTSLSLGLACLAILSAPVAADGGGTNSDPLNPPGETVRSPQEVQAPEDAAVDILLGTWSALWSLIM